MYLPRKFREERKDVLHKTMREIGAAIVVGQGASGLSASHVPIELDSAAGPYGTIRCHLAKANPQSEAIADQDVLLIFQGPQGYVTPNWYPSKHQTGKGVPTWNYVAIHAHGTATTFDDPARLQAHLGAMTDHFESAYQLPWKLEDAPDGYIEGMCQAIIGIEIEISRLEGKWKLSQNRSETDAAGVVNGLRAQGDTAMADLVALANE
ncbi:MAG: FMN-binding negative transcriptional regulator [Alphaproteobacteria bacterium]|jgi:transcriptional regulator|nr:FMN-binding negative transcriptional regulator [Alphaproteobacteria bacterium]